MKETHSEARSPESHLSTIQMATQVFLDTENQIFKGQISPSTTGWSVINNPLNKTIARETFPWQSVLED